MPVCESVAGELPEHVRVRVEDTVWLGVEDGESVRDAVAVTEGVTAWETVTGCDAVPEMVRVLVSVAVAVTLAVEVPVGDVVAAWLGVPELVGVHEVDAVCLGNRGRKICGHSTARQCKANTYLSARHEQQGGRHHPRRGECVVT